MESTRWCRVLQCYLKAVLSGSTGLLSIIEFRPMAMLSKYKSACCNHGRSEKHRIEYGVDLRSRSLIV